MRLLAFLDAHYHHAPHSSLMGRTPAKVWAGREREVPLRAGALSHVAADCAPAREEGTEEAAEDAAPEEGGSEE